MGHTKRKRPRRGSLQFWPRVRAKRIYPKIRNWKTSGAKLAGFCGYKAGMTHVIAVDNRPKSPTKGEEIRVPVTILEVPPLYAFSLRFYDSDVSSVLSEIWADEIDKNLARKASIPKKKLAQQRLKEWEGKLDQVGAVRVLVHTKPLFKKTPEIMEFAVGGSVKEQFDYAISVLGKGINADQILQEGQYYDTHSVTKGKGYQGATKRFGLKLKRHKSEKGQRGLTTLGNWDAKTWRVAHPGQMGYHGRTEYNKQVLKIGKDGAEVTPHGGIVKFGNVKGAYALVAGSVGGPKKRLIRLTLTARQRSGTHTEAPQVLEISRRPQQ